LPAQPSLDADFFGDAGHLFGEDRQGIRHVVDGFGQSGNFTFGFDGQLLFQAAVSRRRDDLNDAADLPREVRGHNVDVVGQIFPGAGDPRHDRLAAELPFGADFARDAGHFSGEGVELIDHRIDGFFQL
jgi:hypothetical protein